MRKCKNVLCVAMLMFLLTSFLAFNIGIPVEKSISTVFTFERNVASNTFSKGTPHAVIHINGNANFATQALSEGWAGDGTAGNPYIIDGLDIDASGGTYCIWIENTDVYFVISNCTLINAGSAPGGIGIYLYNVTNARLENNTCSSNVYGIRASSSNYNLIINNNCSSNSGYGIRIESVLHTQVNNNTMISNAAYGIYIISSSYNDIADNICRGGSYGMYLQNSYNNYILNNNCSQNTNRGISLYNSANCNISKNICMFNDRGIDLGNNANNNVLFENTCSANSNGIYIISSSYNDIADNICRGDSYGMYLQDSNNNYILNNNCSENSYGIYIEYSSGCVVHKNRCDENTNGIFAYYAPANISENICLQNSYGLYLYNSNDCTVSYNNFSLNINGIRFYGANNNKITYNDFYKNSQYAIYLPSGSTGNVIHYNYFEQNNGNTKGYSGTSQAYDDNTGNSWYNETEQSGNYWSNWDGSGFGTSSAYPIAGSGNAYDKYPTNPQAIPEFPRQIFVLLCISFISIAMLISRRSQRATKNTK